MNNHSLESEFPEPSSVTQKWDGRTGQHFLQGIETADADRANVFGDTGYSPAGRGLNTRSFVTEVEVRFRFAEGSVEDFAEVHSFWARAWRQTPEGLQSEILINGEDFNAHHEEDCRDWADLLRVAVERIRNARYNRIEFEPRLVGAPETK